MNGKYLIGTTVAAATLGLVLAGCSNSETASPGGSSSAPPATSSKAQNQHNQADVNFAQQMVPHHAQAVDMGKMVAGRSTNPKVISLAKSIDQAQGPEIQQMNSWLKAWGQPAGATGMQMPGMSSGHNMPGMSGSSMPSASSGHGQMPGMMSETDMAKLRAAKGAQFDTMWLRMMVQHHQGAVDMSNTELRDGSNAEAKSLARKIIAAQQKEIAEMNGLLGMK